MKPYFKFEILGALESFYINAIEKDGSLKYKYKLNIFIKLHDEYLQIGYKTDSDLKISKETKIDDLDINSFDDEGLYKQIAYKFYGDKQEFKISKMDELSNIPKYYDLAMKYVGSDEDENIIAYYNEYICLLYLRDKLLDVQINLNEQFKMIALEDFKNIDAPKEEISR